MVPELDDLHELMPPHTATKPTTKNSDITTFAHFFIVLPIIGFTLIIIALKYVVTHSGHSETQYKITKKNPDSQTFQFF